MRRVLLLIGSLIPWMPGPSPSIAAVEDSHLEGVRRVVFLGDSITYAGGAIEFIEAYARVRNPDLRCEFLNLGLPSETVSGLSEPGHAGGAFPRPHLLERLDRVLDGTKPDLVVACYGMNDGIYHPFDEERFEAFREGMQTLREKVAASGAKMLHVTPSVFDPSPILDKTLPAGLAEYRQPYVNYDDVLKHYADWLRSRQAEGWEVVDAHGFLKRVLEAGRQRDPDFRLANDGVHINSTGHWILARAILDHWGLLAPADAEAPGAEAVLEKLPAGLDVLALVQEKQRMLKDAWLSETKHERPGMKAGLPLPEALERAEEIVARIDRLLSEHSEP